MNDSSEEDATNESDGGLPEYPGQSQGLIVWYLAWFYASILNAISDQQENSINDSSEEDATNEGM